MIDLQLLYLGHYNRNICCQSTSETETEESGWSVQGEAGARTESVQSEKEAGLTGVNKEDENGLHNFYGNKKSHDLSVLSFT